MFKKVFVFVKGKLLSTIIIYVQRCGYLSIYLFFVMNLFNNFSLVVVCTSHLLSPLSKKSSLRKHPFSLFCSFDKKQELNYPPPILRLSVNINKFLFKKMTRKDSLRLNHKYRHH